MIAMIDVDPHESRTGSSSPRSAIRTGRTPERGIFRSTDGGQTFQKVLYKDEYTSGNDVRIDPIDPNIVYATLWQQQQSFIEGGGFGGAGNGIFKSTDGGTTWKQLTEGLPSVIQANIAIAPSNPKVLYATVGAAAPPSAAAAGGAEPTTGVVGFYKSTDGGEHWTLVVTIRAPGDGRSAASTRGRWRASAAAICRRSPSIRRTRTSSTAASTVFWRTEDGGVTWSAVRGAPGGDDYQKIVGQPEQSEHPARRRPIRAASSRPIAARRGATGTRSPRRRCITSPPTTRFPYRVCGGQQDSGSACVDSRSMDGEITFHDWHPVNIQEYGIAAPDPKDPDMVYGSARTNVSLYNRQDRPDDARRARAPSSARGELRSQRAHDADRLVAGRSPTCCSTRRTSCGRSTDHAHSWTRISPDLTRQTWARARDRRQVREHGDAGAARQRSPRSRRRRATST